MYVFKTSLRFLLILLAFLACSTNETTQKRPVFKESSIFMSEKGILSNKEYKDYTSWSLYTTVANKTENIDYSIYESKFNKYILISEDKDSIPTILLEYIGKKGQTKKESLDKIEQTRNAWVETCNNHQVNELIENFYTAPPNYYNHKPMVTDQDSLFEVYRYMENEDYNLSLRPLHLEQVNENLVFEIGQCVGSYKGKYVLVWQKQPDGEWKIHLDSNY